MFLHPDPVAQDGAPGIRARRVDRHDADRLPPFPQMRGDPVDEGRFPRARRPRYAEDVGASRMPVQLLQCADRRRDLVVEVPHQPRCGPGVSGEDLPSGGVHCGQWPRIRSRAMMIRWTSDVPSPISHSFASRMYRSAGYSCVYPYPPNTCTALMVARIAASDAYSLAIAASR